MKIPRRSGRTWKNPGCSSPVFLDTSHVRSMTGHGGALWCQDNQTVAGDEIKLTWQHLHISLFNLSFCLTPAWIWKSILDLLRSPNSSFSLLLHACVSLATLEKRRARCYGLKLRHCSCKAKYSPAFALLLVVQSCWMLKLVNFALLRLQAGYSFMDDIRLDELLV